jgi:hypothetical protein
LKSKLVLGVVAMMLTTGCTSGSAGDRVTGTSQNAGQRDGASSSRTLPIEAYMLTSEQESVVFRAVQALTRKCMEKQGFDEGLPDQAALETDKTFNGFLYRRYSAVEDEATARKYGIHLPVLVDNPVPPSAPSMSAEFTEALFGSMAEGNPREQVDVSSGKLTYGGCMGQAEKALVGNSKYLVSIGQTPSEPVRKLNLDPSTREDPRVVAAQAAWSKCMAEAGYELSSTVADVEGIPGVDITSPTPSQAEISLALQQVKCQKATDVVDIWFKAESQYQTKKIDEDAQVFAQVKAENTDLLQRAADLVGEETP